jgi:hypothetical protein
VNRQALYHFLYLKLSDRDHKTLGHSILGSPDGEKTLER